MKKQYLFAIIIFLIGLVIFVVLNYTAKNQKSAEEKTKEVLDCIKDCYDKYSEAEKGIPEGYSSEFIEIREDYENCKAKCDQLLKIPKKSKSLNFTNPTIDTLLLGGVL